MASTFQGSRSTAKRNQSCHWLFWKQDSVNVRARLFEMLSYGSMVAVKLSYLFLSS